MAPTRTRPDLLTDTQLARMLRVPLRWLRAEADAGHTPAVRADQRYLLHGPTVERLLVDRAAKGDAEGDRA